MKLFLLPLALSLFAPAPGAADRLIPGKTWSCHQFPGLPAGYTADTVALELPVRFSL